jgi:hypothetical protein
MPPDGQLTAVLKAAEKLQTVMGSSIAIHVMQHLPPDCGDAVEQPATLPTCFAAVRELAAALPPAKHSAASQVVGILLKQETAQIAGKQLAWLLQQPQQLQLSQLVAVRTPRTVPGLVFDNCVLLDWMAEAIVTSDANSAAALVASMTQQLEQSGGATCLMHAMLLLGRLLAACSEVSLRYPADVVLAFDQIGHQTMSQRLLHGWDENVMTAAGSCMRWQVCMLN